MVKSSMFWKINMKMFIKFLSAFAYKVKVGLIDISDAVHEAMTFAETSVFPNKDYVDLPSTLSTIPWPTMDNLLKLRCVLTNGDLRSFITNLPKGGFSTVRSMEQRIWRKCSERSHEEQPS